MCWEGDLEKRYAKDSNGNDNIWPNITWIVKNCRFYERPVLL